MTTTTPTPATTTTTRTTSAQWHETKRTALDVRNGTAAEDCRCEGCIRHRLTLAHQDRPKPCAWMCAMARNGGNKNNSNNNNNKNKSKNNNDDDDDDDDADAGDDDDDKDDECAVARNKKNSIGCAQWNSGRGLPLRGVYPTPSHIGAPGPPETTCRQGQVTRGGSSSMGKSAGTTACCQRGLVFYGQVTGEKGQRRIKKMYVEATASKQKPDCLGMRKDTRYT